MNREPRRSLGIITGDALEEMAKMEANSIDTIITDPPYGLRFMGKKWDYQVPSVEVWQECLRVAKPGATLLCFAGTRTQHRMAVNIEDAGWRLIDCLMWLYGQGFPKATDISKQLDKKAGAEREIIGKNPMVTGRTRPKGNATNNFGAGTNDNLTAPATPEAQLWDGWKSHGLKPAYEPIILAMKPNKGSYAENALKHGVGGLWIDGARIEYQSEADKASATPQGECTAKSGALAGGTQHNGEREVFKRPEQKGRYPANLILDSEAARLLDETTGILHNAGNIREAQINDYNASSYKFGIGKRNPNYYSDSGGASRFFYCAKASRRERGPGNDHSTVKPLALMQYLCRLTKTPTGGVVLDPFCGSGSTLVAAQREGRGFIGIDQDPKWTDLARHRIEVDAPLLNEVEVR